MKESRYERLEEADVQKLLIDIKALGNVNLSWWERIVGNAKNSYYDKLYFVYPPVFCYPDIREETLLLYKLYYATLTDFQKMQFRILYREMRKRQKIWYLFSALEVFIDDETTVFFGDTLRALIRNNWTALKVTIVAVIKFFFRVSIASSIIFYIWTLLDINIISLVLALFSLFMLLGPWTDFKSNTLKEMKQRRSKLLTAKELPSEEDLLLLNRKNWLKRLTDFVGLKLASKYIARVEKKEAKRWTLIDQDITERRIRWHEFMETYYYLHLKYDIEPTAVRFGDLEDLESEHAIKTLSKDFLHPEQLHYLQIVYYPLLRTTVNEQKQAEVDRFERKPIQQVVKEGMNDLLLTNILHHLEINIDPNVIDLTVLNPNYSSILRLLAMETRKNPFSRDEEWIYNTTHLMRRLTVLLTEMQQKKLNMLDGRKGIGWYMQFTEETYKIMDFPYGDDWLSKKILDPLIEVEQLAKPPLEDLTKQEHEEFTNQILDFEKTRSEYLQNMMKPHMRRKADSTMETWQEYADRKISELRTHRQRLREQEREEKNNTPKN